MEKFFNITDELSCNVCTCDIKFQSCLVLDTQSLIEDL